MPHAHHAIDYIELPAPDVAAARSLYANVFGWEFNDYGPECAGIPGHHSDGPDASGVAAHGRDKPLILLDSTDSDATLDVSRSASTSVEEARLGAFDGPTYELVHASLSSGSAR